MPTTFGRMAPTLPVKDMARALEFYSNILGMKKIFENGDPVGFAILERDGTELHLTLTRNHSAAAHNVAHLLVNDAQALHDHLESSGVRIVKGLRNADHKMRGFVFADPDGNRIDVGQDL